jgi:hypothetical protein
MSPFHLIMGDELYVRSLAGCKETFQPMSEFLSIGTAKARLLREGGIYSLGHGGII